MKIDKIHIVYFLGIGGIGMSALARWFHQQGIKVCGYDKTSTPLTRQLEQEGMLVHYEDDVNLLPEEIKEFNEKALIVYTPAIPKDHKQFNFLLGKSYIIRKRSEVLGLITADLFTVAIAGTHGKTTTTSMVAHLATHAGMDCTAFLGGISVNYNSNLLVGDIHSRDSIVVVEADEYDRSFLTLNPDVAVITSADADHLDIYEDASHMLDSFKAFIKKIKQDGRLFIQEKVTELLLTGDEKDLNVKSYRWNGASQFASNIKIVDGEFHFDYTGLGQTISGLKLKVPGYHNLENAVAAISVGVSLGIDSEKIKTAITSYAGVKRRFEYIIKRQGLIMIDDYAHHPVELEALLKSARALFPGRLITVLFQPHLFSRTRDFAGEFAASLSLADEVLLMDIYPARELPIPGVTSDIIFSDVTAKSKKKCDFNNVLDVVKTCQPEVLIVAGAGNIDQLIEPLKKQLI